MPTFPVRTLLGALLLTLASSALVATPSASQADGAAASSAARTVAKARSSDPRFKRGLFVDDRMKAANAGSAFQRIGKRAQPLWITDYYQRPADARAAVSGYTSRAADAGKTPLLVIYNIPGRDCGLYSAQQQQINARYYKSWVTQAAKGIGKTKPIVILEPDALPFIGFEGCNQSATAKWPSLLKHATRKLTKAGAWVYIDAGHSGWRSPKRMASLLTKSGIRSARGFATNVANSRTTANETKYAKSLIKKLKQRNAKGVRYVMDTSRNGAGSKGPANGDVCNPTAARLGADPKLVFKGAFDGRLWVKLPGESDGPCNGGPGSGEFFPTGACRLMRGPGFYYDSGSQACKQ